MTMTTRERIEAVLDFKKPDRLPVIEWAPFWDETVKRWKEEGLPANCNTYDELCDYFELDPLRYFWTRPRRKDCPGPDIHGKPFISSEKEYDDKKKYLYPRPAVDPYELEKMARLQSERGAALWCWFEGFFWHPRILFGIEEHLFAFYDNPTLMNRMNEDNLEYLYRVVDEICSVAPIQFLAFGEDMSFNSGPMLSRELFDEFLLPFYKRATAYLKAKGIKIFVDSDGLIDELIGWCLDAGCEGFLPLEKHAGVDIVKYRDKYPELLLMGAFDKISMYHGEAAMREEFERILPVMKQGGYIPGVDHQTPPEVSLDDYRLYLKLLREYCRKAVL